VEKYSGAWENPLTGASGTRENALPGFAPGTYRVQDLIRRIPGGPETYQVSENGYRKRCVPEGTGLA